MLDSSKEICGARRAKVARLHPTFPHLLRSTPSSMPSTTEVTPRGANALTFATRTPSCESIGRNLAEGISATMLPLQTSLLHRKVTFLALTNTLFFIKT